MTANGLAEPDNMVNLMESPSIARRNCLASPNATSAQAVSWVVVYVLSGEEFLNGVIITTASQMWCMEIVIKHPIDQNRRGERVDQMMPRFVALLSSN